MKNIFRSIFISLAVLPSISYAQGLDVMNYREIDGNTQHLYTISCFKDGNKPICSIKAMSISNSKSPSACTVRYSEPISFAEAVNPQPKTYTITSSAGLCGYTNTYMVSPSGMVQIKSSPEKIPEKLKDICQTFPPKTYNIPVEKDGRSFKNVSIEGCPTITVMMD